MLTLLVKIAVGIATVVGYLMFNFWAYGWLDEPDHDVLSDRQWR